MAAHAGECHGRRNSRRQADGHQKRDFAHNHPEDPALLCAERHANPDFARAPRDRVSHNPVQSNGCEQRRQESEDRGEAGNHTLGQERIADLFLGGSHGVNREVRIHLASPGSRGAHYRSGIDGRPHVHRHAALAREACSQIGNKRLFRNGISQTGVFCVFHNADNFHVRFRSGVGAET